MIVKNDGDLSIRNDNNLHFSGSRSINNNDELGCYEKKKIIIRKKFGNIVFDSFQTIEFVYKFIIFR